MQTEEFVRRVEQTCPDLDRKRSQQVCVITVGALCNHLSNAQAKNLASQLPEELAEAAEGASNSSDSSQEDVTLESFYNALVSRAEINHRLAEQVARAVAQTLREAVSDSEAVEVTFDLPDNLKKLLAPKT